MNRKAWLTLAAFAALFLALAGCGATRFIVSGVVRDTNSQPVSGVWVSASPVAGTSCDTTDAAGVFELSLPKGNYAITASLTQYVSDTELVAVAADIGGIELILTPMGPATASALGTVTFASATLAQANLGGLPDAVPDAVVPLRKARPGITPRGVMMKFRADTGDDEKKRVLSRAKVKKAKISKSGAYELLPSDNAVELMERLRRESSVEYAQLNHANELCAVPNDPQFSYRQWNLSTIGLPAAWDFIKGSNGSVVVAVLDTGITANADLGANIVAGFDAVNNDSDPTDDVTPTGKYSHGTHVASIIGAVTNNATGLAGAGWNIKVMPIKVFSNEDGALVAYDFDIAEGIRKAVDLGAKIINLSLGTQAYPNPVDHDGMEQALAYASQHNVAVFAATGNDGTDIVDYPASSSHAFGVGAVGSDGIRADYSNYGSELEIMGPGGSGGDNSAGSWVWGYAGSQLIGMCGTSQATPHAAAVAALLYTAGVTDPDEVCQILIDTAVSKSDTLRYGAGILDAGAAVGAAFAVSRAEVCAATTPDNGLSWNLLTAKVQPDGTGNYAVQSIPSAVPNVYIIAFIDTNKNNRIDPGEFFGRSASGYLYADGQQRTGVNVAMSKSAQTIIFRNQQ